MQLELQTITFTTTKNLLDNLLVGDDCETFDVSTST